MVKLLLVTALLLTFAAFHRLVSGVEDVCSAYVYPSPADVDIKIAVVLGIRESADDKCSSIFNTGPLQNAVALNWAVNMLNGNNSTNSFIPGVRFGIEVYDDCNTRYLAASHAGILESQARSTSSCPNNSGMTTDIPLAGVIGSTLSYTTTVLASILKPSYIPLIGPSATVSELSDKSKYPYFARVVPSDLKQVKLIVRLAKYFSWNYIVGLSTSDNYGTKGMAELKKLANEEQICVSQIVNFDVLTEDDNKIDKFVHDILITKMNDFRTNMGIVYFGLNPPLVRFLKFVEKKISFKGVQDLLKKLYWVASDGVEVSKFLAGNISQYSTNIVVVGPNPIHLNSFQEYFKEFLKNPLSRWINEAWRMTIRNVVRNNLRCNSYNFTEESMKECVLDTSLDSYIPSTLDALYLLAGTLKTIHNDLCEGASGVCAKFKSSLTSGLLKNYKLHSLNYSTIPSVYLPPEFSNSSRQLINVSGDFELTNQPLYSLQAIRNQEFVKVGEYRGDNLVMYDGLERIFGSSECKETCKECLYIEETKYLFQPGEIILLGIFSIHWKSDQDQYLCGHYREKSSSYVAMEAFINAISFLKNSTGINFGYLILDDCYNTVTLSKMLIGVMTGDIKVQNLNDGKIFNSSRVVMAIGAQSSQVTMAALPILTALHIPMISYSATTPILDNSIIYPYFFRTVSSDTIQARAFVEILKGLEVTYVGAIVVENSYGLELYKIFRSMAESERICVDDPVNVTEKTSEKDFDSALSKYKNKDIQVIVIIAMDKIVTTFFKAVKKEDIFVFIGSEAWGPNPDIISNENNKKSRGSLVLGATYTKLNYNLKEHLETLNPFSNKSTVWMKEFWQDQFHCDMPGGFNNLPGLSETCKSKTLTDITSVFHVCFVKSECLY